MTADLFMFVWNNLHLSVAAGTQSGVVICKLLIIFHAVLFILSELSRRSSHAVLELLARVFVLTFVLEKNVWIEVVKGILLNVMVGVCVF